MWKSVLAATAVSLGWVGASAAQISGQSGPIQIEADQLDFLDREGQAIYLGNVDAIQGDARIRAEKLTIFFEQDEDRPEAGNALPSAGAVKSLLAEGTVYYITPQEKAKGDRGEYDYETDTITLTGNVILTRGENVITGDSLVVNVTEGTSRVSSESRRRGERVTTVINTQSDG